MVRPSGIAGEMLIRRLEGLRADEEYVRDLHARFDAAGPQAHAMAAVSMGGTGLWSTSCGFLMTAEEDHSLWRRQAELQPLAQAARAYLADLPTDQAGSVWLEQVDHTVGISLTARADAHAALTALRAQAAPGQHVRAVQVRWSTTQLEGLLKTALAALGADPPNPPTTSPHQPWRWGADPRHGASITVSHDLAAARTLVAQVVNPCAVRLIQQDPPSRRWPNNQTHPRPKP